MLDAKELGDGGGDDGHGNNNKNKKGEGGGGGGGGRKGGATWGNNEILEEREKDFKYVTLEHDITPAIYRYGKTNTGAGRLAVARENVQRAFLSFVGSSGSSSPELRCLTAKPQPVIYTSAEQYGLRLEQSGWACMAHLRTYVDNTATQTALISMPRHLLKNINYH